MWSQHVQYEQEKERDEIAFYRAERITAYSTYIAALRSWEDAMYDSISSLDGDESEQSVAGMAENEARELAEDAASVIDIVGSQAVISARHDTYQAHIRIDFVAPHDPSDTPLSEAEVADISEAQNELYDIVACSARTSTLNFLAVVRVDLGVQDGPPYETELCSTERQ